ncbi:MAG: O-antigen ligase family protein [Micropruina sp.]
MLGATGAATLAVVTPRSYAATATVLLSWVGPEADVAEPSSVRYVTSRAQTYALLAERPAVLEDAIKRSGLDLTPSKLRSRIETYAPTGAQIIRITAWSTEPQQAADLANATAEAVAVGVRREEVNGPFNPGNLAAVVAVEAVPPSAAATPRVSMYLTVGSVLGLAAGLAIALVLTYLAARRHPRAELDLPTPAPLTRRVTTAHLVWALLIAAVIPWRSDTFYDGGADPVVLAKAGIALVAMIVSGWAFRRTPHRHPVPAAPVLMILAYLAVTVIGGLANYDLSAALVVAARVGILLVSLCLLAASFGPQYLLRSLVHVLAVLISVAGVSGLAQYSGRLGGALPTINPNLFAILTAVVAIYLVSKVLAGSDSIWELAAIVVCIVAVVLTGSRTGLAAMVLAFVAMLFRATRLRRRTLAMLALALPALVYLVLGTDVLRELLERGGGAKVATLSNRTIAWEAALNLNRDVWQTWFGQGLAQKKISVTGQYWETQLLDSSWVSAVVQGGILGLALVVLIGLTTLGYAAFSSRAKGAAWLGLAVFTLLGGFLESGLFDGSVQFMVFLVTALGAFDNHAPAIALDRRAVTVSAPRVARQKMPVA